jgi:hypothetical protein
MSKFTIRKFPLFTTMTVQEWLASLSVELGEELISVIHKNTTNETIYYFKKNSDNIPTGLIEKRELIVKRGRPSKKKLIIEKVA